MRAALGVVVVPALAVIGVVAGATAGPVTVAPGAVWVVPTMFSVAVTLGLAVALVRLPHAWVPGTTATGSAADRVVD